MTLSTAGDITGWPESGPPIPGLPPIPSGAVWPRLMTAPHPRATGSYGPEFLAWTRERFGMHPKKTTSHRWWQQLVAHRALEHDEQGRLVWRTVVLSTARQVGKSWLLRELCMWRLSLAGRLGEVQTVVHAAAKLSQAYGVWRPASRWARHNGYEVRLANGEQMIGAPDGSQWLIQAANDDLGVSQSVSFGLIDEAWRVRRDVFEQSLEPTGAEAADSQMFLVSTAGVPHASEASDLMPVYRGHGLAQMLAPRALLMLEWSAPRGCDIDDPAMWRLASPHWTEERAELVADKRAKATTPQAVEAFGSQWLNQWRPVVVAATGADVWLPAELVAACARDRVAPAPLVGALEVGTDQVSWAACVTDGDRVAVLPSASFEDALGWLLGRRPPVVLAHQAVVNRLPQDAPWEARPVRTHEVAAAVSLLADRVRAGAVVWDHGPEVGQQFADAVLAEVDGLRRVVDSRSRGPVALVKCMSWALWWAAQNPPDLPAVF